ncbi:MAG: fibronectin type III domain-containing protein [Nitrospirota bacterium]
MKWIRLLITSKIIIGILFIASCGSSPEVEKEELLARHADERDIKGSVFVSPTAHQRTYQKVAVMPFRAPVELVGASISDMFTTEILKTYKYQLIERSQMEQVLGEQALGLKGVTDSALAIKVGNILGVQGVIVGTIPEYGSKASGSKELSSVGINIRMIDVTDGSIVWTITDSAISDQPVSLSSFAKRLIQNMVSRLFHEWIKAGDTFAVNLPTPQIISSEGKIRGTVIDILSDSPQTIREYKILRSRTEKGPYQEITTLENRGSKTLHFEDRDLLDAETYHYKIVARAISGMTSTPFGPVRITTAGPPGSVAGLSAQSGLIRKVIINWKPGTDPNLKGYHIYRKTQGGSWEKIKILEGTSQSTYTDESLKDGKPYSYRIVAFNTVGAESPPSQTVTTTTKGAPSTVRNLKTTNYQARKVPLSWSPVNEPEVMGYAIYRASKENGPFEMIKFVESKDQSQFVDGGKKGAFSDEPTLQDETRYFYKVTAVNVVDVRSPDSPVISAITKSVPKPVMGFNATQLEVKQVSLSWQPNPEKDIAKYVIYRGDDSNSVTKHVQDVPTSATNFTDRDLKDGTKYYYRVRAIDNDSLEGKFSHVVSSSTKPVPSKPQALMAQMEGERLKISWKPNPEQDIAKYVVYQKGFLSWNSVGETTETSYNHRGEFKKGKTLTFRVKAIDKDNLEGEPSLEVSITIP